MADHPKTGKKSGTQNAPIPITVLCVAVLVAFMVWWGIKSFGPEPVIITEAGKKMDAWLDKISLDSKGDFSKLSPADQGAMQKYSWGHGEIAIKGRYKELSGK